MTDGDARDWSGPEGDDELVAAARRDLGPGPSAADVEALAALRVVSGTPDEDELAALLAGLATARALSRTEDDDGARAGQAQRHDRSGRAAWDDHGRRLGVYSAGPDAWRWSARR